MNKTDVDRLLKAGKIRGFTEHTGISLPSYEKALACNKTKPSMAKNGFKLALLLYCMNNNKPLFIEQMFHGKRKWRLDFLIPGPRPLALEYEGIYSEKSRHTTMKGFVEDGIKYRALAIAGITLMRFTAKDWKSVIEDLTNFYKSTQ